jgi:hypothetical protein
MMPPALHFLAGIGAIACFANLIWLCMPHASLFNNLPIAYSANLTLMALLSIAACVALVMLGVTYT